MKIAVDFRLIFGSNAGLNHKMSVVFGNDMVDCCTTTESTSVCWQEYGSRSRSSGDDSCNTSSSSFLLGFHVFFA
jgi:hypothetical protein